MRLVEPVMWLTPVYFMSRSFQVDGVNTGFAAYTGTSDYMAYLIIGGLISSYVSAVPVILILVPFVIALYGFGFGLAGVVLLTNNANNVIDIVSNNITVLSGSQFPVTVLPRPLLAISLALPLTYAYDAARGVLLKTTTLLPFTAELLILVVFMFVSFSLGYVVFRGIEKKCRSLGTLAQH